MATAVVANSHLIHNDLSNESGQSLYACTPCRRSKIKCDRMLKECGNCIKASKACTYPLTVQKPGPKAGTHRRSRNSSSGISPSQNGEERHSTKKAKFEESRPPVRSLPQERSDSTTPNRNVSTNLSSTSQSSKTTIKSDNPFLMLVHPGHDPTDVEQIGPVSDTPDGGLQQRFHESCHSLGVSDEHASELIDLYFETMTSFSLFHRPTFEQKLASISQPKHLQAFLSAIFSYALRFKDSSASLKTIAILPRDMLHTSLQLQHDCLEQCLDDDPPLHLLQSYFLVTWQLLIHGVRGKTWRMLGDCVRLGIELRLNLVDVGLLGNASEIHRDTDSEDWVDAEEKRRIWWALWEMDIFTSTIRRLPNAIDDRLNYTLLPAADDDWFTANETRSCFLVSDAAQRWREVVKSQNKSPQTWFILINSYMYDGFQMSTFPDVWQTRIGFHVSLENAGNAENVIPSMRLYLEGCLRGAFASLPHEFSCDDKFLAFKPPGPKQYTSSRTLDCFRFCIYVMRQLSRLTIFIGEISARTVATNYLEPEIERSKTDSDTSSIDQTWNRYVDAANSMAQVIRNSSPHSYRFVNPLIANAIWYAAASLVVVKLFGPIDFDARLAQSNFELLVTTLNKFEAFWQTPSVLKYKLKYLEETLQHLKRKPPKSAASSDHTSIATPLPIADSYERLAPHDHDFRDAMGTIAPPTNVDASNDILASLEQIDWTAAGIFDFSTMPTFGFGQADLLQAMPFDMNYNPQIQPQTDFVNLSGLFSYPYQ